MKHRKFSDLLEKKHIEDDQLLSYVYLDTFNVHHYRFYKYQRAEHTFSIVMVNSECHQFEYWSTPFDENKINTLDAIYQVMQSWDSYNQKTRKHDISKDLKSLMNET